MVEGSKMPAATAIKKRRFNVHEYHRMAETGILTPDDRVQLLDGEVVVMAAVGSRHAAVVTRLNYLFTDIGKTHLVRIQQPVRLGEWSEPEPDVSILEPRTDFYDSAHPTPEDTLLVIEVSLSTLRLDREVKLPLYAAAGIAECWIVNLEADRIEVSREPGPEGYGEMQPRSRGESITPVALPEVVVAVDDIIP
jgi:Uma2 family endonuclease